MGKSKFLELFVYHLDLLVEHLPGKPIDRHVHPVVLFTFHDEIVSEALCVWLVAAGLGHYINKYVPDASLGNRSHRTRKGFSPSFNSLIVV